MLGADGSPEFTTRCVAREHKQMALANANAAQARHTFANQATADTVALALRCHSQVMNETAPSVVAHENRADQQTAGNSNKAQTWIAQEELLDGSRFVRVAEADARRSLPQLSRSGIVRWLKRNDLFHDLGGGLTT
jgi:hypothetical protein